MRHSNFVTLIVLVMLGLLIVVAVITAVRVFSPPSSTDKKRIDENINLERIQNPNLPGQLDLK
ncbi:MAG TPA: hypothetical protein VF303_00645 [Candidatus Nanoarchaeia archaeon]